MRPVPQKTTSLIELQTDKNIRELIHAKENLSLFVPDEKIILAIRKDAKKIDSRDRGMVSQ